MFFYWASQAMFLSFINKKTFQLLRVGLIEAAKGLETDAEDSDTTSIFDNQGNDGSITF